MYSSEVSIESWLSVKCFLAAFDGTLVLLRLAVDGLNVHQEIVTDAKTTSTLFALEEGRRG